MHNKLPTKYYFINKFDTNHIDKQDKNTAIIYRNYSSNNQLQTVLKFKKYCRDKGYKFFLSNNTRLAVNLNLDGAYIPSFNKKVQHLSYSFKKNFLILGSAHNNKEIKIKELQKVSIIFLSSLFKKNNNYLGLNRFRSLSNLTKNRVVALGGISIKNFKKLKLTNTSSFAGISFFNLDKKKGPKGPF